MTGLALWLATSLIGHADDAPAPEAVQAAPAKVVVIPVRAQISEPELFIVRRGVKEAMRNHADMVVLDMETPGGKLDVTFEILKVLEKFQGKVVTYVNREAISAGALIAAGTDEIYFSPDGVIGSAAPVLATGGEMDATMKMKIVSYLKARVRSLSEGKGFRGEVISAMIDENMELKIGDQVIKPKGDLLNLTAQEAMREYPVDGDAKRMVPLLGAGIAPDLNGLLQDEYGARPFETQRLETTWSEQVAQYLTLAAPVLLGLGLLALFIEFKTPGFGVFGISGIVLMAVVFLGHHVAGLSGAEPLLVFLLGLCLLLAEIFFMQGMLVPALLGICLMVGSLVWSMVDHWPGQPVSFTADVFMRPLANLLGGFVLAVVGFIALLKILPKGGPFGRMVLDAAIVGTSGGNGPLHEATLNDQTQQTRQLVGSRGVAATPLMPSGQVEIGGKRYEARVAMGNVDRGTAVVVRRVSEFGLLVEVAS